MDAFFKTDGLTRPIWAPREYVFTDVPLKAGLNTLRFAIDSKNPDSAGYRIGLDCVVLDRMGPTKETP